jgi:N-methylhydantoinase A/oxoprolinase/acetone carboxylase beta subunit
LGGPATTALPPAVDWPKELKEELIGDNIHILNGGYEFTGEEISPLDIGAIQQMAQQAAAEKVQAIAIAGVFANLNANQERQVGAIFATENPEIEVSLSHTMGNLGLLARENATILNACLAKQHKTIVEAFKKAIAALGLKANIFLTCGDGTKVLIENNISTPLRTLNSGAINSIKGAAFLAKAKDAVTIDIGGTTSDIGLIKEGKPVNESSQFFVGGVNCNFNSARLESLAQYLMTLSNPDLSKEVNTAKWPFSQSIRNARRHVMGHHITKFSLFHIIFFISIEFIYRAIWSKNIIKCFIFLNFVSINFFFDTQQLF